MISGAYTSTEKAGRLFFKRTAAFFREDSDWDAGLLARDPKDIVHFLFADASNAEGHLSGARPAAQMVYSDRASR